MELKGLIIESAKEYIKLCDKLMGYEKMGYEEKANWVSSTHGFHVRYENRYSQQVVEAPYERIKTKDNVDAYFWRLFINTTPKYHLIKKLLDQNEITERELLNRELDDNIFQGRNYQFPELKVGDFIQLRKSTFQDKFESDKYWHLKYYYEDRFAHIYWPLENNFNNRGENIPTIFGGIKTQIKEVCNKEFGISTIYTDLFIIDMPFAYEKNQFKLIDYIPDYKINKEVNALIEDLSFYEKSCNACIFTPAERENNKIKSTQQCFELMMRNKFYL
ncbi:hypothetical protein R9C00_11130 [Flammeovirgaceae bacterium SG7u.111]|nr:hypothetical protein [Flammeovirgaceae bacterium SG7u.132]WPO38004.1 hypothetical protein R9C00_11130 [Flammeovirgaceae bacterium SG7u.111]